MGLTVNMGKKRIYRSKISVDLYEKKKTWQSRQSNERFDLPKMAANCSTLSSPRHFVKTSAFPKFEPLLVQAVSCHGGYFFLWNSFAKSSFFFFLFFFKVISNVQSPPGCVFPCRVFFSFKGNVII